jgi:hypothetical protein
MPGMRKLLIASATLALLAGGAAAQPQCNAGPRCTAALAPGEAMMGRLLGNQVTVPGVSGDDVGSFCLASMMAEFAEACAEEFRAAGNEACAVSTERDGEGATQAATGLSGTHAPLASRPWQATCGWQ